MTDTRVAYGATCTYWGNISTVGKRLGRSGHVLPCCPHCGGMLFELPTRGDFMKLVHSHAERTTDTRYVAMIEWSEGKQCFRNLIMLTYAYDIDVRKQEWIDSLPVIGPGDFL